MEKVKVIHLGFEKTELCVIRCLKRCLLKSYIRPHNPVSMDTVSRWLKEFLRLSGIDTSIFTGHRTRTGPASKAKQVGLSLPEISKRGSGLTRPRLRLSTTNQLWIIQWKFCKVNSFVWVVLYRLRFYGMKFQNFVRARSS